MTQHVAALKVVYSGSPGDISEAIETANAVLCELASVCIKNGAVTVYTNPNADLSSVCSSLETCGFIVSRLRQKTQSIPRLPPCSLLQAAKN